MAGREHAFGFDAIDVNVMSWRPTCLVAMAFAAIAGQARAAEPIAGSVVSCLRAAGTVYRLPVAVEVILLNVEGGSLGAVTQNTNGTVDIGPMQVNTVWVPVIARHWRTVPAAAYAALRDNFCANVEAGSWILRQAIDEAHGDFWEGVGFYHSHDPGYKADYLRKVLRVALQLQSQASHAVANIAPRS